MSFSVPFSSQRRRVNRRPLIIATIIGIFFILLDLVSGGGVRSALRLVLTPGSSFVSAITYQVLQGDSWATRTQLQHDNELLRTQVTTMQAHDVLFQGLQHQNAAYTALLRIASSSEYIGAHVISSPFSSPYGTIILDAGGSMGVQKGDFVVESNGFVVGTIVDVRGGSATASLIFASQRESAALINSIPVTVYGRGGGNAFTTVPRGSTVHVGDTVTIREFGNRVTGVVGSVIKDATSADQKIFIGTPYSIHATMDVAIIHSTQK